MGPESQRLCLAGWRMSHAAISPLPLAQIIKHHPASVDLELIKRLAAASKDATLLAFLSKSFACVSRELSGNGAGGTCGCTMFASTFPFHCQLRIGSIPPSSEPTNMQLAF